MCRSKQKSHRRPSESGPAATPSRPTPMAHPPRSPEPQHLPQPLRRWAFRAIWPSARSGLPTLLSPRPPGHRQCGSQRVRRQPLQVSASAPKRPPYGATRLRAPPRVPEQDSRRGYRYRCLRRRYRPHRSGPHRPTPPPPLGRRHRPLARNREQSDETLSGPDPSETRPRSTEVPRSIALPLVLT